MHRTRSFLPVLLAVLCWAILGTLTSTAEEPKKKVAPKLVRSAGSGPWSAPATWEGGRVPAPGDKVQIRPGHTVQYNVRSEEVIRSLHIAGTLTFATDRDTRLDVGLIKIQAGDNTDEEGFDCDAHLPLADAKQALPTLLVGTPQRPVEAGRTALLRLHHV